MDIQASLFQSHSAIGQQHNNLQSRPDSTKPQNREGSSHIPGNHSAQVMERLTGKLIAQSENPDKVAEIKAKIAAGTFEIDPGKIADKFLWGERIAAQSEIE